MAFQHDVTCKLVHGRMWGLWRLNARHWTLDFVFDPNYRYVDLASVNKPHELEDWIGHYRRKPGFCDEYHLRQALFDIFGDEFAIKGGGKINPRSVLRRRVRVFRPGSGRTA